MKEIFIFKSGYSAARPSFYAIIDGVKKYVDDGRDLPWGNFIPKWIKSSCPYIREDEPHKYYGVIVTGWAKGIDGKTKVLGRVTSCEVIVKVEGERYRSNYRVENGDLVKEIKKRYDVHYFIMGAQVASKYDVPLLVSTSVIKSGITEDEEPYWARMASTFQEELEGDKEAFISEPNEYGFRKVKIGDKVATMSPRFSNTLLPGTEDSTDRWKEVEGGVRAVPTMALSIVKGGTTKPSSYDHELGVPQGGWAEDAGIYGWDLD